MRGSRKLFFDGPAGKVHALWRPGHRPDLDRAVVLCHPHPRLGGTMENIVVARTAQYLSGAGIGVLCFNFRGVGQSEGEWAGGEGERSDVEAAVDHVLGLAPNARLTVAGYSFGAWVGLSVGASDRRVDTLVGIAPPVILYPFDFLRCSAKPKLLIYAGRDKIVTPWAMTEWIDRVAPPKAVRCLPDADHYFSGRADDVAEAVTTFVSRL